jgi:hypothetical protein
MPLASFNGPWAKDLNGFTQSIASMPYEYRDAFEQVSTNSISVLCNKEYLHIWETDSDIESLLQLTQVIVKVRAMKAYVNGESAPLGMIILVELDAKHDHFERVCAFMKHITGNEGRPHLNGKVVAFGGIKVVESLDNSEIPDGAGKYVS